MPRTFYGIHDVQYIAVRDVFAASPVTIASPIDRVNQIPLMIEGPKDHLDFFYRLFPKLFKQSLFDKMRGRGGWIRLEPPTSSSPWITLWYKYGRSLVDHVELLEHKFRRDAAVYCDLMLADWAILEVTIFGKDLLRTTIFLPEELPRNGTIVIPQHTLH